jgi:hypothetical protein
MKFLDLTKYKTMKCPKYDNHNKKKCPYFHDEKKEKRRPIGTYKAELCPFAESQDEKLQCPGENCSLAHNNIELLYHPDNYKAQFCRFYPNKLKKCDFGESCAFAHSKNEIAIDLLHIMEPKDPDFYVFYYKTAWCPWNMEHDKYKCVYAHNWNDYRRKPHLKNYEL